MTKINSGSIPYPWKVFFGILVGFVLLSGCQKEIDGRSNLENTPRTKVATPTKAENSSLDEQRTPIQSKSTHVPAVAVIRQAVNDLMKSTRNN